MKNILVAYDGSESAKRALARAAELAADDGGAVSVVSVATVIPAVRAGGPVPAPGALDARADRIAEAKAVLEARGIAAHVVERTGDPAAAIVHEAETEGAELIVVGTRGLNAVKRSVLGSVSTSVVHTAPCDVLVVR